MRNQRVLNFRVGLFVLITLSLFVLILFFLTGEQRFYEKSYTLTTSFTNPDAKATIRTEGLLGDKYIEVIPGVEKPMAKLPDSLDIESQTPIEFASIIGQSGDLLANIISISESLDKIVKAFGREENINNISKTLASLRASSEAVQKNLEAIEHNDGILNTMIYGEKDKSGKSDENALIKLNKAVTKLDNMLNQIDKGDGTLHDLVYNKELSSDINSTVANLKNATANLNGQDGVITELKETMSNFREISEMLKGGEGTLGALLIDPSVYDSLKGILGEAERSRFVRAAMKYFIEQEKAGQSDNAAN